MVCQKSISRLPTRYSGLAKKLRRALAQISFPYVSKDYGGAADDLINPPAYQLLIKETNSMEPSQITETKKRTLGMMQAGELAWKFKSKRDFVIYLDQHRRFIFVCYLTHI